LAILRARLVSLISVVAGAGGRLVLVDDIPMVCQPEVNFLHTVSRLGEVGECSVADSVSKEDRRGLTVLYKDLSTANPGDVFYFDPHDALCQDGRCNLFDPLAGAAKPRILYGDGIGHFRPEHPRPLVREWKLFLADVL
jgi:hypothetical protein